MLILMQKIEKKSHKYWFSIGLATKLATMIVNHD